MKRAVPDRARRRLEELSIESGLGAAAAVPFEQILIGLADEHSPTAIKDPAEGVDSHIADSLAALVVPEFEGARSIADIGSGCGVPGLVLAVANRGATVFAVESIGRKCSFIEATAAAAGLDNVEVVNSRAEEWTEGAGLVDLVTARALAPLPVLAEYAAPLLRDGGTLIAWKGDPPPAEIESGRVAAGQLGLEMREPVEVEPWPGGGTRRLITMTKVGPTPERFPRRAGMAVKRPIA